MASCVLVAAELPKDDAAKLGKKQQAALEVLRNLHQTHVDNLLSAGFDADNARVSIKDWYAALHEVEPHKGNRTRLRQALIERGLISVEGVYVSLI